MDIIAIVALMFGPIGLYILIGVFIILFTYKVSVKPTGNGILIALVTVGGFSVFLAGLIIWGLNVLAKACEHGC